MRSKEGRHNTANLDAPFDEGLQSTEPFKTLAASIDMMELVLHPPEYSGLVYPLDIETFGLGGLSQMAVDNIISMGWFL